MNTTLKAIAGACAAFAVGAASAATFDFDGSITQHNEVVQIAFSLDGDATNVKVWTDSFQNGANFDPITAVWRVSDGLRMGENDDNAGIAPGQTVWDSGLVFSSLEAGDYLFTIAVYSNFSNSTHLSDGFRWDDDAPLTLAQYYGAPRGGNWSVHLSGVDDANGPGPSPIPEPSTYAMMFAGLGVLGAVARRRRQA